MKTIIAVMTAFMMAAGLAQPASAQDWPQQPIRIIVSFGPGGGADIIARILADSMQSKLGKPVVVENKPGAGGIIGNEAVASAAADGYTLGIMTAGQIIAAVTRKTMRYNTLTAFAPVGQIATASLLIVTRPDFPANSVQELVAAAKADPGKIVFASPGFAATQHFAGEMFKQTAKVDLLHVPFKTSPEAINAVLGKHADVLFDTVSALIGQVQSGQLKALAVTGKDRFPAVPNIPAASESGVLPGYDVTTWYGLFAPRGTPAPVIARLNKVLNESLADETVRKRLETAGVIVQASTPQAFGDFMTSEYKRWDAVREAASIDKQ
jgi:tripartite-type tricarboxylate transporter receptor subunit TctC